MRQGGHRVSRTIVFIHGAWVTQEVAGVIADWLESKPIS
jgi:hypothetical protein